MKNMKSLKSVSTSAFAVLAMTLALLTVNSDAIAGGVEVCPNCGGTGVVTKTKAKVESPSGFNALQIEAPEQPWSQPYR